MRTTWGAAVEVDINDKEYTKLCSFSGPTDGHNGCEININTDMKKYKDLVIKSVDELSEEQTGEKEKMEKELALPISRVVHSGPKGGDQEVGTLVVEGLVNAVFFFPDPLTSQPHFMDVGALQRVCDVCHVPIATNKGSAFHLFNSLSK